VSGPVPSRPAPASRLPVGRTRSDSEEGTPESRGNPERDRRPDSPVTRGPVLCSLVLCSLVLCSLVLCSLVLCSLVLCSLVLCSLVLCSLVLWSQVLTRPVLASPPSVGAGPRCPVPATLAAANRR